MSCDYLVGTFRNVDGVLNARCALSGMPLDASGREGWDGPLTSHTDDGFSSCLIHSDCPVGRFCALVNAPDASAAACMSCTHCCAAQAGFDTTELFNMPMYGSEPGCGHCQCDECSPGCSWDMLHNDQCDEQCFTEACRWDALACGAQLSDGALSCPLALDRNHTLVPVIGAQVGTAYHTRGKCERAVTYFGARQSRNPRALSERT